MRQVVAYISDLSSEIYLKKSEALQADLLLDIDHTIDRWLDFESIKMHGCQLDMLRDALEFILDCQIPPEDLKGALDRWLAYKGRIESAKNCEDREIDDRKAKIPL